MTSDINADVGTEFSIQQSAKIAGFALLFMFIAGIFGISPNSEIAFEKIINSPETLKINIAGDIMMLVFDVVAALGLYFFLKPVNKSISLLASWFRLTHVAIYGAAIINLLLVLSLLSGSANLTALGTEELHAQIMFLLNSHEGGFRIGLVFFAFHFFLIGYLIFKSTYVPNILGIFWMIVSIVYFINSFAGMLMPNFQAFENINPYVVYIPAIIAELSFCLWLLFKGSRLDM